MSITKNHLADILDELIGQLRAYAIIACGSKEIADKALVEICNQLVENISDFSRKPRVEIREMLYRMVEAEIGNYGIATKYLDEKLFVLIAIEGFSPAEASNFLGLDRSFVIRWAKEVL